MGPRLARPSLRDRWRSAPTTKSACGEFVEPGSNPARFDSPPCQTSNATPFGWGGRIAAAPCASVPSGSPAPRADDQIRLRRICRTRFEPRPLRFTAVPNLQCYSIWLGWQDCGRALRVRPFGIAGAARRRPNPPAANLSNPVRTLPASIHRRAMSPATLHLAGVAGLRPRLARPSLRDRRRRAPTTKSACGEFVERGSNPARFDSPPCQTSNATPFGWGGRIAAAPCASVPSGSPAPRADDQIRLRRICRTRFEPRPLRFTAVPCLQQQSIWLGWQDSNLRMPGSKPGALPLGDTPEDG